ncbi:hypothetical protein PLESTM_001927000 [Pleodorina starrii]|nr:hypothetical protein PLESTM_001927000 [Pleodorina starrii]
MADCQAAAIEPAATPVAVNPAAGMTTHAPATVATAPIAAPLSMRFMALAQTKIRVPIVPSEGKTPCITCYAPGQPTPNESKPSGLQLGIHPRRELPQNLSHDKPQSIPAKFRLISKERAGKAVRALAPRGSKASLLVFLDSLPAEELAQWSIEEADDDELIYDYIFLKAQAAAAALGTRSTAERAD